MGLIYAYLLAWVVGGVLLGARILLTHRDGTVDEVASEREPPPLERSSRLTSLGAAALVGFGLFGLVAEGLGLLREPWTAALALAGSALLTMLSYLLRGRGRLLERQHLAQ